MARTRGPFCKRRKMSKLNLNLLTICDLAMISQEGKLSIIGIFDRMFVRELPSSIARFFVVALVTGKPGVEYKISLQIKSPSGKDLIPTKELSIVPGENSQNNILTEAVNLPLTELGEYKISLKHNDEKLGETQFVVMKVQNADKSTKQSN